MTRYIERGRGLVGQLGQVRAGQSLTRSQGERGVTLASSPVLRRAQGGLTLGRDWGELGADMFLLGPGRRTLGRKQRFFLVELESKVQMVEMAQWTIRVSPLPRRLLGHYIKSGFLAGAMTLGSSSTIFFQMRGMECA